MKRVAIVSMVTLCVVLGGAGHAQTVDDVKAVVEVAQSVLCLFDQSLCPNPDGTSGQGPVGGGVAAPQPTAHVLTGSINVFNGQVMYPAGSVRESRSARTK